MKGKIMSEQNESMILEKTLIKEPYKYKVVFYNDNVTPMGFVTELLIEIFDYTNEKAIALMLEIHHKDKGVAGIYIKSIAETRQSMALDMAKKAGYPLKIMLEEE